MRFTYVILALSEELLEFFIVREVSVYRYRLYKVTLKSPIIAS
jgi:hypothetical protein